MKLWKSLSAGAALLIATATLSGCSQQASTSTVNAEEAQVVVTDIVGRTVTFDKKPERIILGEGRSMFAASVVNRENPTEKIVGLGEDIKTGAPSFYSRLVESHPETKEIPMIGSLSKADVSIENLISLTPDVIMMTKDHYDSAKDTGLTNKLDQAGMKYVVTDFRQKPLNNTTKSMDVFGAVFDQQAKASEFNQEWQQTIDGIKAKTANAEKKDTFVWRAAGFADCCASVKNGNIGEFVQVAGGKNLGDTILDSDFGSVTPEKLIELQPENILVTGGSWAKKDEQNIDHVTLGYLAKQSQAEANLKGLTTIPGMDQVNALSNGHSAAFWHQLYDSPMNFLAIEFIAKWLHPELFADLDPQQEWQNAHEKYVPFASSGVFFVDSKK